MSYRAFKRLLGETSLERKCRFLFGAGILLLITLSFWIYAYQTENLAYDQTTTTCRVLVMPIFERDHLEKLGRRQREQVAQIQKELDALLARREPPAKEADAPKQHERLQKQLDETVKQWE